MPEFIKLEKHHKIFLAGHSGLVGSAILRCLNRNNYNNIIIAIRDVLDLTDACLVNKFFDFNKIDCVILAAAKVGGILANNTYPYDFISQNLKIQTNVINAAVSNKVRKFLFLGSSCIYPKLCPQPMKEEYLLTGDLEDTNRAYAIAKIAGIELCRSVRTQHGLDYVSVMPTNLYGPNDNFDLETSHVLPALIRKFHEAKENNADYVCLWGSGSPRREFLHSDDVASACLHILITPSNYDLINIGCGQDISILDLAKLIGRVVGYTGDIRLDPNKPDGTPQKLLNVDKLFSLGWAPKVTLETGVDATYKWFLEEVWPNIRI